MLALPCPWCGPRDESEFRCGGQAGIAHPPEPQALTDEDWGTYLFHRDNSAGAVRERWCHSAGCRRWFELVRHAETNALEAP